MVAAIGGCLSRSVADPFKDKRKMSWQELLEKACAKRIDRDADPWRLPLQRLRGQIGGDGVERITPFSNKPTALGACVLFATTNAISGNLIPTKTTSPSLISRAAATTMSSLRVYCICFFLKSRIPRSG